MRDALGSVQKVVVLGGGSDIARATARALAADGGVTVTLAGRHPEQLEQTAADLRTGGAEHVAVVHFDADDLESHPAFVDEAFAAGDVDVVLVAFGLLGHPDANRDRATALALYRTNVVGTLSVMMLVADRLRTQGHGTVVVLSSVAGERVRKSNFVYGSSKAAIDGFAAGLGDSLAGSGVHVLVVRPGFVDTKMTAGMKRPPLSTSPDRVATAIVAGIRRRADVVWVPSSLRWVMAVVRHLPRKLFRRLDF